jgi:hypothetical protein
MLCSLPRHPELAAATPPRLRRMPDSFGLAGPLAKAEAFAAASRPATIAAAAAAAAAIGGGGTDTDTGGGTHAGPGTSACGGCHRGGGRRGPGSAVGIGPTPPRAIAGAIDPAVEAAMVAELRRGSMVKVPPCSARARLLRHTLRARLAAPGSSDTPRWDDRPPTKSAFAFLLTLHLHLHILLTTTTTTYYADCLTLALTLALTLDHLGAGWTRRWARTTARSSRRNLPRTSRRTSSNLSSREAPPRPLPCTSAPASTARRALACVPDPNPR